jgi:DNA invertase Pin-like site-specific DNA recombinase
MKGRWLGNGHDGFEGQRRSMCVVTVGNAADRMPQDFDRRLRHVLVVVGRTGFPEILEFPRLVWPQERVVVIDDDLGISGSSSEGRLGFQRLLSEVALNHVGLILGIEMSRLARSCKDWYQLLELCAIFNTLICDLDGVYGPTCYNDRLLLGLKGTMSEAELHILRQRMWKGALQKAKRGDLVSKGPMGYRREGDTLTLDPDEQAQSVIRLVFEQFDRLGTMHAVLRHLVVEGIRLPVRSASRVNLGELEWRRPNQTAIKNILTHPIYAGAYVFGRSTQSQKSKQHKLPCRLPRQQWLVLLRDRYPAYISWSQYEENQFRLAENRSRSPSDLGCSDRRTFLLKVLTFPKRYLPSCKVST